MYRPRESRKKQILEKTPLKKIGKLISQKSYNAGPEIYFKFLWKRDDDPHCKKEL